MPGIHHVHTTAPQGICITGCPAVQSGGHLDYQTVTSHLFIMLIFLPWNFFLQLTWVFTENVFKTLTTFIYL